MKARKLQRYFLKAEQKYRELANCLPDIVFEIDLNGQVEFANQAALKFRVIL